MRDLYCYGCSATFDMDINDSWRCKNCYSEKIGEIPPTKKARKALALSQAQLAPLLGVSVRTIQDYEQGKCKPSKSVLMLLELELKK